MEDKLEKLFESQNHIKQMRDFWANEVNRLKKVLSENKIPEKRNYYLNQHDKSLETLREWNFKLKENGTNQNNVFCNVVQSSCSKEVYNRIRREIESRMIGNEPRAISLLDNEDENTIEKYTALNRKYNALSDKIKALYKEIDNLTIIPKDNPSPSEWNDAQIFNRHLGKLKREVNKLLIF